MKNLDSQPNMNVPAQSLEITLDTVKRIYDNRNIFIAKKNGLDSVDIRLSTLEIFGIGTVSAICVSYVEYGPVRNSYGNDGLGLCIPGFKAIGTQYFDPDDKEKAFECFVNRYLSNDSKLPYGDSENLDDLFVKQHRSLNFNNHYTYLEFVLDEFWKRIFGKTLDQTYCTGLITAHGDKGYSYREFWESKEVPFIRGMLLYLLTYTKELGDTPKHKSKEWVVDNYLKYLPHILETEKSVLKNKFNID